MVAVRLPGLADLAEQFEPPLVGQFGQRHPHGQADHITVADELPVLVVSERDDQVRPGQIGHCGRNPRQHFLQLRQLAGRTPARNWN